MTRLLWSLRRQRPRVSARTTSARSIAICAWLCLLASLAACTAPADHPALKDADLPALIPAHRFAYQGEVARAYQLSPDGARLAWVGPYFMRSRLFVRDNKTGEARRYRIGSASFQWSPDSRRLLYTADTSGAENTHVYMIELDGAASDVVDLTPYPGVKARIHQFVPGNANQLLITHNRRDRRVSDLYRIDLDTRRETLVAQNPGDAVSVITAPDGRVHGWQKSRDAQRSQDERRLTFKARRPALTISPGESFRALGKSADGGFVWALSSRGRERVALVAVHPTLGWEKIVFEDPHVDVSRVDMSRVTGTPLIAYSDPGYPRNEILDPKLRDDLDGLLKSQGSEPYGFELISTDATEQRLIVLIYTSAQQRYYLVDRASRTHTLLADSIADTVSKSLVATKPVMITSRDGLTLHGYLTLPRGASPKALPLVLWVHGGPWLRTRWGNPLRSDDASYTQFLANRGYAVLQINFRGSTGYGHAFSTAAIGEFAGKMQDDLHDAVHWAIDAGIADAKRIAIMGWSYGGYAALNGLTLTPEVFACGVSLGGPTDLATLIESFPPYWQTDLSMWHDFVGNPAIAEDREEMKLKSPLHHADKLVRPVLIVQGKNDVRVRPDQAERMVEALQQGGKPVEYVAISDMGHGMGYWAHRLAVLRKTETFLQRCIGGRASRFDAFEPIAWAWTRMAR
ncbi:MAG: S9 family peptidase [Pseudomonadota bacterium]